MPTILKGSDYFGVLTYTGDGAASKTVVDTNAVSFQPDFVWVKGRSGATDHALYDAVRGTTKDLVSNSTAAETTQSTGLTGFVNGGFTVGNLAKMNTSGATYTAWCWKAGNSTSSNTSGSITSTVSVNTTAGFSVVTYTGTGANATVGHGLGVAPRMIIAKPRSAADNWRVYHAGVNGGVTPQNFQLVLNSTQAQTSASTIWNNTAPTSSVFSIGTDSGINGNGTTFVAYCWAEIAGFSKAFSYTGNGSTDGPFVFCNFLPRFVLIKRTDSTSNWYIFDTARNTYNVMKDELLPNSSNAEADNTRWIDCLSNGFKIRNDNVGQINANGGTYIGMAWASNPFKNSNAK